ncbi:unnamed protein product [Peronospora farinosa]|uniref:Little elongation complex subunit 2 C-terminal domain-containing protein n=1 Tax=Peronospora farinosa TaxID=134698 RepID=A0ABN8CGJ3_9STRA|nr:unnamed protein product [Peronospora farinosa]
MDTTSSLSAFTVPRKLLTGHKRHADASIDRPPLFFLTFNDFATFSIRGDVQESRFYNDLEMHRRTLVTTKDTSHVTRQKSSGINIKRTTHHLIQLLMEAIKTSRIQIPAQKRIELENARRRISSFSVSEHEQYLMLQCSLFQAQQRGLPEVLALGTKEAKQWQKMKVKVEREQVEFCRMMTKGLAFEAAVHENQVPSFAASSYNAMLTQCWNDIYRLYPRWFDPCMDITLPKDGVSNGLTWAEIETKKVATRGVCCTIDVTKLVSGQTLKSTTNESDGLTLDVALPRQVISTDGQAVQLMETYDCDIAISSSTLVALFDSDTSTRFAHVPVGWGIPMKSRASVDGNVSTKKRIYLDRPLPGSNPGTREKVAEAGRSALLSRFEAESVLEGSTGGRTVYHIWQLNEKRILVRSTTHMHMIAPTLSGGASSSSNMLQDEQHKKQATAPLSVFVKPDYHLLGVEEQLTTSERCRFWFHSWLRGGSTVLVARVNPKRDIVSSWKTYSPTSLIFGDKSEQCLPPECFDPSSKFEWLSMLFAGLVDLPVGNYLLRPKDACGPSTFGKQRDGVEILMATTEPGVETSAIDLYSFMPKTSDDGVAVSSNIPPVLPAWNLCDRIPYTFRTGMYCLPFLLDGVCPSVSMDKNCEHVHLHLPEQRGSRKTKRWRFDNYTNLLKKTTATTKSKVMKYPKRVTLKSGFCGEDKTPPLVITTTNLYTPVHCSKRPSECSLPHLTLHQILERLADEIIRTERKNRGGQKKENRRPYKKSVG